MGPLRLTFKKVDDLPDELIAGPQFCIAFPYDKHVPPVLAQLSSASEISLTVGHQFIAPEFLIRLG